MNGGGGGGGGTVEKPFIFLKDVVGGVVCLGFFFGFFNQSTLNI